MKIQESTNYHEFQCLTGNRVISETKIEKIIADINAGTNLLPYYPILVFEKDGVKYVADGQHRHEVSKRTGNPVYYLVHKGLGLMDIANLNSRSSGWKNRDYLNCYVNLGNKNYVIFRDFISKHGIVYSAAVSLLMKGGISKGGGEMTTFKEGKFEVNHLELAEEIVTLTTTLFERYVFYRQRELIAAVHKLKKREKCDFTVLTNKIKQAPALMDKQSTTKDYLYNIEKVYNHNNSKRVSLF